VENEPQSDAGTVSLRPELKLPFFMIMSSHLGPQAPRKKEKIKTFFIRIYSKIMYEYDEKI